jgi:hypothetical protein
MKLQTLVKLCKKEKTMHLLDERNDKDIVVRQWLGTGQALYPLDGILRLELDDITSLYDFDEKLLEKMMTKHEDLPRSVDFADVAKGEAILEKTILTVNYNGIEAVPFAISDDVLFLDKRYLAPLSDVSDELEIYARLDDGGRVYFAAKVVIPDDGSDIRRIGDTEEVNTDEEN